MLDALAGNCLRLYAISGYDGRVNDVVYCRPCTGGRTTVVFFGGDVQNFAEDMRIQINYQRYIKWNLENTAQSLLVDYPDSHIVVIRPKRMEDETFSCFENFVPCTDYGAPEHTPMHFALNHLNDLLKNISEKLRTMSNKDLYDVSMIPKKALVYQGSIDDSTVTLHSNGMNEVNTKFNEWNRTDIDLGSNNIILIGFSKGCVVLNQFLYECHYLETSKSDEHIMLQIVSKIKEMYWLDGGHSGGKNTWITSRPLLETLARLGILIYIHVTPYQVQDDRRPWIREEEKCFYETLQTLRAPVHRTVHFENTTPNLSIHFKLLDVFRKKNE